MPAWYREMYEMAERSATEWLPSWRAVLPRALIAGGEVQAALRSASQRIHNSLNKNKMQNCSIGHVFKSCLSQEGKTTHFECNRAKTELCCWTLMVTAPKSRWTWGQQTAARKGTTVTVMSVNTESSSTYHYVHSGSLLQGKLGFLRSATGQQAPTPLLLSSFP